MTKATKITCIIIVIILIVSGIVAWDTYLEYTEEKPEVDEEQQIVGFIQESTNMRNNIIISLEDLSDAVNEGTNYESIYSFAVKMNSDIKALQEYLNTTQVPVKCVILKTKTIEFANISEDIYLSARRYANLAGNNQDYQESLDEFERNVKNISNKSEEINNIIRTEFSEYTLNIDYKEEAKDMDL